jgi:hypothetical protein
VAKEGSFDSVSASLRDADTALRMTGLLVLAEAFGVGAVPGGFVDTTSFASPAIAHNPTRSPCISKPLTHSPARVSGKQSASLGGCA